MTEEHRAETFQSVINFARTKYADEIDKAYADFLDEDDPEDFLSGTALELAFINFEDWFVCDYKTRGGQSIIELYTEASDGLDDRTVQVLNAMRESYISLYEFVSAEGKPRLRDLVLDKELSAENTTLRTLSPGDVFATRFVRLDDSNVMSRCVYPYPRGSKERIFEFLDKHRERYSKNVNPNAEMTQFLKDEGYFFNVIWINLLFRYHRSP